MSRTHAHRPLHARGERSFYARHDHRDGVCDLPTLSHWQDLTRQGVPVWSRFDCKWDVDWAVVGSICSCQMCSGRSSRRRAIRAERRAVRQLLASWTPGTADEVNDACSTIAPLRRTDW